MLHFSLASVLSSPSQPVSPKCYLSIPLPLPHRPFALLHLLLNPHSLATPLIRPLFPKSSKISLFQIWINRPQLLFLGQHDSIHHADLSLSFLKHAPLASVAPFSLDSSVQKPTGHLTPDITQLNSWSYLQICLSSRVFHPQMASLSTTLLMPEVWVIHESASPLALYISSAI